MARLLSALAVVGAGALQPGQLEVVAHLRQRGLEQLERSFWEISDPEHPRYLRFMSREEVASLVGASEGDIAAAKAWLLRLGAAPSSLRVSGLRDTVSAVLRAAGPQQLLSAQRPDAVQFVVRREPRTGASGPAPRASSQRTRDYGYTVPRIKSAYGIPADLQARNGTTLQMVWGPGSFGYSPATLQGFRDLQCPLLDLNKVSFDTENQGSAGGDNWEEGNLDVHMIAAFGLNVKTLVSNTNTSASTEEGSGFGEALLDFATSLAARKTVPHVLSVSLGSLASASCQLLCKEAAKDGVSLSDCNSYLQSQRQVCMFLNDDQTARINTAFQVLGVRGVSVFGSSGDGGSHFSFQSFTGGPLADKLNEISCKFQMPVFPTSSPYIVSVGGTQWDNDDPSSPVAWEMAGESGTGGGFAWQFAMPDHQKAAVAAYLGNSAGLPPAGSFNAKGRAYPDISAIAAQGTSQSSPMVAGIFSLLVDQRLASGLPPLGFVAPRLWKVAAEHPGEAVQDVVQGGTSTSCDNGFPARQGWDAATGWGRPAWPGLVKYFGSDAHLSHRAASSLAVVV